MVRVLLTVAGASLVFALGACAQSQTDVAAAAAVEPAAVQSETTLEGDPVCRPAQITLYFSEQVASDEPVVTPLLNDFMDRIHRCEAAGAELRSITIVTTADPGQSASDARAQVRRRIERVSAALVNVGAPAGKIVEGQPVPSAPVMGRRAEITAAFN